MYINDIEALTWFYQQRFQEMSLKPLRKIIASWIMLLEPERPMRYGAYDNKRPSGRARSPPWWPYDCPYTTPARMKRERKSPSSCLLAFAYCVVDLLYIASDLMFVHRCVDHRKRKGSWIPQLRELAMNIADGMPAEAFSLYEEAAINDSIKRQILRATLPTLFDIAEAHEDYVTEYELFEGSGNADQREGEYVTWKSYTLPQKRTKSARFARLGNPASEDSEEMTEVANLTSAPSTSFPGLQPFLSPQLSTLSPNCSSDTPSTEDGSICNSQTMHSSYDRGDPRLFAGTVDQPPTHPTPTQFPSWADDVLFAHPPNGLPLYSAFWKDDVTAGDIYYGLPPNLDG
jgi:hypothetical protein